MTSTLGKGILCLRDERWGSLLFGFVFALIKHKCQIYFVYVELHRCCCPTHGCRDLGRISNQGYYTWAIRWALGCVKSLQEAGFTQPRSHLVIAHLCTLDEPTDQPCEVPEVEPSKAISSMMQSMSRKEGRERFLVANNFVVHAVRKKQGECVSGWGFLVLARKL